jgi:hypothetical protein
MSRPPPPVAKPQNVSSNYQTAMPYMNNMYMQNNTNGTSVNQMAVQPSVDSMMQTAMNVIDFKQDVVNGVVDPHQANGSMMMQNAAMQNAAMQNAAMQNAAMHNAAMHNAAMQNAAMQNTAMQNAAMQNAAMQNTCNGQMMQYPMMLQNPGMFQTQLPAQVPYQVPVQVEETKPKNDEYLADTADPYSNPYYSSKEFKKLQRSEDARPLNTPLKEKSRPRRAPREQISDVCTTFPRASASSSRDIITRKMVSDIVTSALRDTESTPTHRIRR